MAKVGSVEQKMRAATRLLNTLHQNAGRSLALLESWNAGDTRDVRTSIDANVKRMVLDSKKLTMQLHSMETDWGGTVKDKHGVLAGPS